jgi:hypothetical protein
LYSGKSGHTIYEHCQYFSRKKDPTYLLVRSLL